MLIRMKKAQSILEYALLIGVVVGALLGMQNYLKRSIHGRLQAVGDQMGDQYSPGLTYREENTSVSNATIVETTRGGYDGYTRTDITGGHQSSQTIRRIKPLNEEIWFNQGRAE